jgi:predicted ATP-dependent endonuclease of OLD family
MQTKISSISISKFTVFEHNEMQFSPGLNVFIGKNGTGKTHLLKILYALFKNTKSIKPSSENINFSVSRMVATNLRGVFKLESLIDLARNKSIKAGSKVKVVLSNESFLSLFHKNSVDINTESPNHKSFPEGFYIPPQEMLSWFGGFTALWDKREVDFDETYYQLAKALELPLLKNNESLGSIIRPLEKILKAKIVKENGRFYLEYDWGKIGIHLAAEGFRKLATIIYLLANGSINEKTIIFWDEPEVHFNPSLIEALVELIKSLTGKGIQIFITTHDYLLSQRLSLLAEYGSKDFPMKFFCLSNEKEKGVAIEEGRTLADIDSNPILNEFAEYYDFERAAFKTTMKTKQ